MQLEKAIAQRNYLIIPIIFISFCFIYSFSMFEVPIFSRGEGREALVVKEMINSGSYVLPVREDKIASKPPLFHWVASSLISFFPDMSQELLIRMPSAVFAAVIIAVTFFVVRQVIESQLACMAIIAMFSSCFVFFKNAVHARVDMTFFSMLSLSLIMLFYNLQINKKWRYSLLSGLFLGLAILAKGPAALALFGITYLFFFFFSYLDLKKQSLRKLLSLKVITIGLIALFIGSLWYALAYLEGGERFLETQILKENIQRLTSNGSFKLGHKKPIYLVIPYYLLASLPWSFLFPYCIYSIWRFIKSEISFRSIKERELFLFSIAWIITVLVLVTISSSKRVDYFLLTTIPSAIITVLLLRSTNQNSTQQKLLRLCRNLFVILVGTVVLTSTVVFVISLFPKMQMNLMLSFFSKSFKGNTDMPALISSYIETNMLGYAFCMIICSILLLIVISIKKFNSKSVCQVGLTLICLFFLFINTFLKIGAVIKSPKETITSFNQKYLNSSHPTYQLKHNFFAANYYSASSIKHVKKIQQIPQTDVYLLFREDDLRLIQNNFTIKNQMQCSTNNAANGKGRLCIAEVEKLT